MSRNRPGNDRWAEMSRLQRGREMDSRGLAEAEAPGQRAFRRVSPVDRASQERLSVSAAAVAAGRLMKAWPRDDDDDADDNLFLKVKSL